MFLLIFTMVAVSVGCGAQPHPIGIATRPQGTATTSKGTATTQCGALARALAANSASRRELQFSNSTTYPSQKKVYELRVMSVLIASAPSIESEDIVLRPAGLGCRISSSKNGANRVARFLLERSGSGQVVNIVASGLPGGGEQAASAIRIDVTGLQGATGRS